MKVAPQASADIRTWWFQSFPSLVRARRQDASTASSPPLRQPNNVVPQRSLVFGAAREDGRATCYGQQDRVIPTLSQLAAQS